MSPDSDTLSWSVTANGIDLCAVGAILIDHLFFVDDLPREGFGALIKGGGTYFGGRAPNVAAIAAGLGIRTAIISAAGVGFAETGYKDHLEQLGVELSAIDISNDLQHDRSYVFTDRAQRQLTFVRFDAYEQFKTKRVPNAMLGASRLLHISSGDPDFNRKIAEAAVRHNTPISFDVGNDVYMHTETYLRSMLSWASYVFCNRKEVDYLQQTWFPEASIADVVALCPEGSWLILEDDGSVTEYAGPDARNHAPVGGPPVSDRTGSSDGFAGGFLASILHGLESREAVRCGQAMMRNVASAPGCQTSILGWADLTTLVGAEPD